MLPLAVVFARGGSRGLPDKHLLPVAGVPVIGHVVRAARREIPDVYVSTNDKNIACVAAEFGATVIERPAILAQDHSRFSDAVFHALDALQKQRAFDVFVTLEGATLLLRRNLIRGCLDCLRETQAESAVTVVPAGAKHPDWSLELRETSRVHYANSRLAANRQNLRPVFHLSGACRCTWRTALQRAAHASSSEYWWDVSLDVAGFVVDETDYVHIDSRRDLEWAEYLLTRSASYSSSNQGEPTT